jgi:hypothetical protein
MFELIKHISYLDVRIRVCLNGKIENFHLVALPLHDSHTAQDMIDVLVSFLTALLIDWMKKVVGLTTDGARSMTGRIQGLVTRIEKKN